MPSFAVVCLKQYFPSSDLSLTGLRKSNPISDCTRWQRLTQNLRGLPAVKNVSCTIPETQLRNRRSQARLGYSGKCVRASALIGMQSLSSTYCYLPQKKASTCKGAFDLPFLYRPLVPVKVPVKRSNVDATCAFYLADLSLGSTQS